VMPSSFDEELLEDSRDAVGLPQRQVVV
jgi:hypothetical protein